MSGVWGLLTTLFENSERTSPLFDVLRRGQKFRLMAFMGMHIELKALHELHHAMDPSSSLNRGP